MRLRRSTSASSGTLIRKGRISSLVAAGAGYAGKRLAALAAAIPIAAVLKSWRRSRLITSEANRVRIVNLLRSLDWLAELGLGLFCLLPANIRAVACQLPVRSRCS
jgi:hypothetical protein